MKHTTLAISALVLTSLACGGLAGLAGGGGVSSAACIEYFETVESCAAKAEAKGTPGGKAKAEAWRNSVKITREAFEKNPSAQAIEMSCESLTPPIKNDPDCQ